MIRDLRSQYVTYWGCPLTPGRTNRTWTPYPWLNLPLIGLACSNLLELWGLKGQTTHNNFLAQTDSGGPHVQGPAAAVNPLQQAIDVMIDGRISF